MRSIRAKLLVGLMLGTLLCCIAALAWSFVLDDAEADEQSDGRLWQIAHTVPLPAPQATGWPLLDDPDDAVTIQSWQGGSLIFGTGEGKNLPLLGAEGFSTRLVAGVRWRACVAMRDGAVIQVAQPIAVRQGQAARMALRSAVPFAFLLPALGILIWIVVGRALHPLARLAEEVSARAPHALSGISTDAIPPELTPIVAALNHFLRQVDSAITAQRHFVADAAHELRSPLTALKIELQTVQQAPDRAADSIQYRRIVARLDRTIHMTNQLLSLARHEPGAAQSDGAPRMQELAPIVEATIADHAAEAETKGIDLGLGAQSSGGAAVVRREAVQVALRNLVDNALRYTQSGGRVDVSCGAVGNRPFVRVSDNGPGIAANDRLRVLDRFYRVAGTIAAGCGLGLAIVNSVAESHGASLELADNAGGGLVVTLWFLPTPG